MVEKREKTCVLCLYKQMTEHWQIPDERFLCFKCRNQEGPEAGLQILRRRLFNQKTPEEKEAIYKQREERGQIRKEEDATDTKGTKDTRKRHHSQKPQQQEK